MIYLVVRFLFGNRKIASFQQLKCLVEKILYMLPLVINRVLLLENCQGIFVISNSMNLPFENLFLGHFI